MPRRTVTADPAGFAKKFRRAAGQRLGSAETLLEHGFHLEAVYLAGYVAECALKALILRRTPISRIRAELATITRGALGHDLEFLKDSLKQRGATMPLEAASSFRRVVSWSTDLRYEVGIMRYSEAELFVSASKDILDWVDRSW